MTGKDLILYILQNDLEDEPVFKDGKLLGFVTAGEVAAKMDVGVATVYVWLHQKRLDGIFIGGKIYIPANFVLRPEY
jgi:excisionase family DNA binding protein